MIPQGVVLGLKIKAAKSFEYDEVFLPDSSWATPLASSSKLQVPSLPSTLKSPWSVQDEHTQSARELGNVYRGGIVGFESSISRAAGSSLMARCRTTGPPFDIESAWHNI
mmetsp:Transcript_74839/g.150514  ORF Transcript_74839/g.150514 Transcript_74839/m.150514 type:complete len:110 (+) Transcript_74839:518-847(+)